MSLPNLLTMSAKIKLAIAQWIALLIMKDGECSLMFEKVTNLNVTKVVAKSTCITHAPIVLL
jgi:hypothetical protein